MSKIIEKVKTVIRKNGFRAIIITNNEDEVLISADGQNCGSQFTTHFVGKDASGNNDAALLAQTKFPIKVPLNKREKMISFFNHLNCHQLHGWLALDTYDGTIFCRAGVHSISDDSINDAIIDPFLFYCMNKLDELHPHITDLIYTEKSVDDILIEMDLNK